MNFWFINQSPCFDSMNFFFDQEVHKLKPWRNFYGNYQRAYLTKEEHVAGAFGIETRYPFLDRDVVQEFLWLSPEAKNRRYKAPLHAYLERYGYPFEAGKKTGFLVI